MVFNRDIHSCDDRDRWGRSGRRDRVRWGDNQDVVYAATSPYIHYSKLEKKFLASVTRMPLNKIAEGAGSLSLYPKVDEWDDSGALEAFKNAKTRFLAETNGQPCNIPLPDINMFIDEVDYDAEIDPELVEELNNCPDIEERIEAATRHPVVYDWPTKPSGWGDEEDDKPIIPTGWGDEPIIPTGWGDEGNDKPIVPTGWGDENDPVPLNNNAADGYFTGWNDCQGKHNVSDGWGDAQFFTPQSDAAAGSYVSGRGTKGGSNNELSSSHFKRGGYANGGSYNSRWGHGGVQDNSWGSRRRNSSRGRGRGDYADNKGNNNNTWGASNNINESSRKNWRSRDREGSFGFRSMEQGHQAEDYHTANRWRGSRARGRTQGKKTVHPKPPLPNGAPSFV